MRWSAQRASGYELALRDSHAAAYDSEYVQQHGAWFPEFETTLIRDSLDLQASDTLVDLGCGTGRLTTALAPLCKRVIAIDRSPRSLEILQRRIERRNLPNVTLMEADATRPLPNHIEGTKVVSVQLLQHIPTLEARLRAMANIARILEPDGLAVVTNEMYGFLRRIRGAPQELDGPGTLFFHTFTPSELIDLARQAGLKPLTIMACGTLYWTRYRIMPRTIVKLDGWTRGIPGAIWISKYGALVASKV